MMQIYEVFRREKAGEAMLHAGSVSAESPELALLYARELFGRRGESQALWVAPRSAFSLLDDDDMLQPAIERPYRTVEGYRMRDKLAAVGARLAHREDEP